MDLRITYISMAVLGTVIPAYFLLGYFATEGLDLLAFLRALYVNGAAGGLSSDLFISSFVFWIYMFSQKEGPKPWLYIILNLFVGLSLALPLYLWATTKK